MGYMNRQWLDGEAEKSRRYKPVETHFWPMEASMEFDEQHGVVLQLEASSQDGDSGYQYILFTETDVRRFVKFAMRNEKTRDATVDAIASLSDDEEPLQLLRDKLSRDSGED